MTDPKEGGGIKKTCSAYSLKTLSLFADNELSEEETQTLSLHIQSCPLCADRVDRFRGMDRAFDLYAQDRTDRTRPVQISMDRLAPSSFKDRFQTLFGILKNPTALRLASITAAALIISLALFQMNTDKSPGPDMGPIALPGIAPSAAPSAIVKTVDTESSSVMILETEIGKHTIIWFSEA
ncbi:anti-sigma factor family protein [Desulfospira joergensenii]|uniref:anti-sigma factor family protein n=1 Tax=Desulfospira joergensenii TaxID=53329 RepID=UPI0003B301D8|nr:zf-HC2 domain-containing protein [Desulfospira joergensenii]